MRNLTSWVESRDLWNDEATKVRAQFNRNMAVDGATAARLMREGAEALAAQTHPDNYIHAAMPGGSLFMRNPAIPLEAMYPDGVPAGKSKRRFNVDYSNVPDDQEYADDVLVDSSSKSYWLNK